MQRLEGSGTPVLYKVRKVLKGQNSVQREYNQLIWCIMSTRCVYVVFKEFVSH
jgi:hypothetical protein